LRCLNRAIDELFHRGFPPLHDSCGSHFFASDTSVLAGTGGGRQGEQGVAAGAPAAPGPLQVGEGDDGLVAVVLADRVLAAFPVAAGSTQRSSTPNQTGGRFA